MPTERKYFLKYPNGASALQHFYSYLTTPSPIYESQHIHLITREQTGKVSDGTLCHAPVHQDQYTICNHGV